MSRRAEHRRADRANRRRVTHALLPDLPAGEAWGMVHGVASPDAVDELRQTLHDRLLDMMGPHRTGGVRWLTYDRAGGLEVCARSGWPDAASHLTAWPDAVLVVALASGTLPVGEYPTVQIDTWDQP